MNPLLFVYGTLQSGSDAGYGRAMHERLRQEGTLLGPATLAGRLYDLGRYPGVVDPMDAADIVSGELHRLTDPARSFGWLDAYEKIDPEDATADNEYARVERSVHPAGAATPVVAWVYLYRWDVSRARHVPEGRWR